MGTFRYGAMLSSGERRFVLQHAYIPEHLVHYFTAIADAEPHLISNYLCYQGRGTLSFIGYPLAKDFEEEEFRRALQESLEELEPERVSVVSPIKLEVDPLAVLSRESDFYLLLHIEKIRLKKKLRNQVRSASSKLGVAPARFGEEHIALVEKFLSRGIDEGRRRIYESLGDYASLDEPLLLEAKNASGLAAFSIFDFSRGDFGFYMFNFMSRTNYVPGASDLLFWEFIREARARGKLYINMGLGINEGVARFKLKWGGERWLRHELCSYDLEYTDVVASYRRLGT